MLLLLLGYNQEGLQDSWQQAPGISNLAINSLLCIKLAMLLPSPALVLFV